MRYKDKISILGLGYVGLPLAIEFSLKYEVVGYDIDDTRVLELKNGIDRTNEVTKEHQLKNKNIKFTCSIIDMKGSNYFIITVPTPITKNNKPDLSIIKKAAETIAKVIDKGAIIVLESTVYPGVTENFLIPIIERNSKLKHKIDFFVGYSPERINPGETKYKLTNITKVIGADSKSTLIKISRLYKNIIKAGVHKVSSIKVAEASKAIENAQRDINIAFINEVMMLSKALKINSYEVLEAAKTKWNFLDFKPGLVGGHCIGVDPYYLAEAGRKVNFKTNIILAGRKLNDSIPEYIYDNIRNKLKRKSRILILGLAFKEDVGDIRNSKAVELAKKIKNGKYVIDCFDPKVSQKEIKAEYNIIMKNPSGKYDCIIAAVSHKEFINMKINNILGLLNKNALIVDIKGIWQKKIPSNHKNYWCL
ncbi:MAG: hypothetical protein CMP36_01730 [Rickettsiales bacterium]|nr:hypothetical protein [Rickettsiales bacterium]OUV81511.1 MAG: hypothetical protein CBC91_02230 [Rickettsiales bacterium TMED131]